jgi:hypothetical protein
VVEESAVAIIEIQHMRFQEGVNRGACAQHRFG